MTRRIAHVISTPRGIGGAERTMLHLVGAGGERGWEQIVVNPFAEPRSELARALPTDLYRPLEGRRVVGLPRLRARLSRELRRLRPDVVHAHLFHASVLVATLRLQAQAVLSHQHGNALELQKRHVEATVDRIAGKRFDQVVAISEHVRRFLIEDNGYPEEKVVLIRNGWDGEVPDGSVKADRPTVISVGNLRPEKGHAVLLEAFRGVLDVMPAARLILVGDGALRETLEAQARSLEIASSVEFRGSTGDVWPHLAEAHVFVLPSLLEMLGIAVMEAMAAGLPVVASDVGGVSELVIPGETGELVPSGDPRVLCDRIALLLRSRLLRERMGDEGRIRAQGWHVSHMIDRYFELYEERLAVAKAPG